MRPMAWPTTRSPSVWTPAVRSSLFGANASLPTVSQVWKSMLVRVVPGLFPPDLVVQIKALACELPAKHGLPLSRWSTDDLVRQVCQSGLVASISGSTLWRWLHEDAIRPWYHRSWIFPRDPDFAVKAGRILDLYARQWQGRALKDDEFVISADEKTSIQARRRKHATQTCRPRTPDACRARVLPLRRLDLYRRAGCPPRPSLWPLLNRRMASPLSTGSSSK